MSVRVEGQGSAGEGQGWLADKRSATCQSSPVDGGDCSAKNEIWIHVDVYKLK